MLSSNMQKNPSDYIKALQEDSSHLAKAVILREAWNAGCFTLFEGFQAAYDPFQVFNIRKVPEIVNPQDLDDDLFATASVYGFPQFRKLLDKLMRRELTGNAARDAVRAAAEEADVSEWNLFMRRVLLKDMRCGVTATTINKILDEMGPAGEPYKIKFFTCQLATDGTEMKITGKRYLDHKLDGVRCLAVLDKTKGSVNMFSRSGKPIDNFQDVCDMLAKILPHIPGSLVLDGEMTARTFQDVMKGYRATGADTSKFTLCLFDIIPLDEFLAGGTPKTLEQRHAALCSMKGMFQEFTNDRVVVLEKMLVDLDTPQGQADLRGFNKKALDLGLEGIMVKDPQSPYECRRGLHWLKIKPTVTFDLEILDMGEGTGKNVGTLGQFVGRGHGKDKITVDVDGSTITLDQIEVKTGGGFSDAERREFWDNKAKYIGFIYEVEVDGKSLEAAVTKNQGGGYSLRFNRFLRLRGTKPGEKL